MADSNMFPANIGNQTVILKKNAEQADKIQKQLLSGWEKAYEEREAIVAKSIKRIEELQLAGATAELTIEQENLRKVQKLRDDAKRDLIQHTEEAQRVAADIAMRYEINRYKQSSAAQRRKYHEDRAAEAKELKRSLEEKYQLELAANNKKIKDYKIKQRVQDGGLSSYQKKELEKLEARNRSIQSEIDEAAASIGRENKQALKFSAAELAFSKDAREEKRKTRLSNAKQNSQASMEAITAAQHKQQSLQEDHLKRQAALSEKIRKAENAGDAEKLKNLKKQQDAEDELFETDMSNAAAEEAAAKKQHAVDVGIFENLTNIVNGLANVLENTFSADSIDSAIDAIQKGRAKYTALLRGTGDDWGDVVDSVTEHVGFSGITSSRQVIDKMQKYLDVGVAYNLELRAFLAETSDNIAATFNAFDSNLLRLIRVQQADTTAARLGMESNLTELFNKLFNDTSYLAEKVSDQISGAILDASAMLDKNSSLEFEYTLQKWLGALYSLGMSQSGVTKLAQGINYLGTGNVSALSQDSTLQTLLAMSASRSGGKSYASMLTEGLTAEDTNKLLRAMIEYLAEIATSDENNVTKAAYADIFGLSITDLKTFSSLTEKELNELSLRHQTFDLMMETTSEQLSEVWKNMSVTELINNVLDNATLGAAATISDNAATYGLWKTLGFLKNTIGELKIPSVMALGSGIGDLDLLNVAQTGLVGMGVVGSILGGLGSIFFPSSDLYGNWGFEEYNPRGNKLGPILGGILENVSLSSMLGVGSASSEDIEAATFEQAEKRGKDELDKIQSEELEEVANIDKRIYDSVADEQGNTVLKVLLRMCGAIEEQSEEEPTEEPTDNPLDVSGGSSSSSSSGTDDSSLRSPSNKDLTNSIQDSETYNKIYEAIAEGESVNVLSVLKEINDKLALDRVFYTSIASVNSGGATVGALNQITSSVQNTMITDSNHGSTVTSGGSSTTVEASSSSTSGNIFSSEHAEALESIIAAAVEIALERVAGVSTGQGLPVMVTNLNPYGGGF